MVVIALFFKVISNLTPHIIQLSIKLNIFNKDKINTKALIVEKNCGVLFLKFFYKHIIISEVPVDAS